MVTISIMAVGCVEWRYVKRYEALAIADYRSPRNATQRNAQP